MILSTNSKVPVDDCFSGINSNFRTLSLESGSRSRNSTIVPIFQNLLLFMSVFYCVCRKYFLSTVAMTVRIKQDDNYF